jgi:NADH-quinone oxidoreductase subunit H
VVETLDQLFVLLSRWLVALAPEPMRPWLAAFLGAAAIVGAFAGLFALATWLERKGLGRIQNRPGPNRVGPFGLLQPAADGLKMLTKEDIVPRSADAFIHFAAPILKVVPVLLAYAVIPFGRNLVALDLDAGLLFFFAVGSATELAVFMAGWGSRNKYSLLGAMRAIAQLISYEMPLVVSALGVVMVAGTLSLPGIVDSQTGYHWGWLARWHVFTPWGLAGFLLFMTAATAKTSRAPFDLPEGESEIIAGHMLEYSGFKYALFFMGEYLGLFAVSAVGITLFLGGWREPVAFLAWVPSYAWFAVKLLACIAGFIWLRGTVPRLRADQLMGFAWKFLLPLSLITAVAAGLWQATAGWTFTGAGLWRWALGAALILVPYQALGRALFGRAHATPRRYRFAD